MKVAELESGSLYRVSRIYTPSIRIQHKDDVCTLASPVNMLNLLQRPTSNRWRPKPHPYPINPPMVYLGIKYFSNLMWGMKKYHWFLAEGKEVGLMGHDVRSLEHV
jgi:hypothetical protein